MKKSSLEQENRKSVVNQAEYKHFDFMLGDFNMLLEIEKKQLQPILFDYSNFEKNKPIVLKTDQMKIALKKCKMMKNFREAEISK